MALFSTLSELVNKLQTLAVLMALFSKNITKFDGRLTNCQPWQFWWHKFTVTQTADLGSFNGTFQQGGTFGQQTADLGSFNGTFQQRSNVSIKLPTSGSFNATFQSLWTTYHKTADLGSFNGTLQQDVTFGQQTANLGSFDGTFQQCKTIGQQTANISSCHWVGVLTCVEVFNIN